MDKIYVGLRAWRKVLQTKKKFTTCTPNFTVNLQFVKETKQNTRFISNTWDHIIMGWEGLGGAPMKISILWYYCYCSRPWPDSLLLFPWIHRKRVNDDMALEGRTRTHRLLSMLKCDPIVWRHVLFLEATKHGRSKWICLSCWKPRILVPIIVKRFLSGWWHSANRLFPFFRNIHTHSPLEADVIIHTYTNSCSVPRRFQDETSRKWYHTSSPPAA